MAKIEKAEIINLPARDPRPTILLQGGQLHAYAAEAEGLLATDTYVRGGKLVRLGKAPELKPEKTIRDAEQCVIVPVTLEFIRRQLSERGNFQKFALREKEWRSVDCPKDLAANIAGAGDWPSFPALDAVATAPFLRADLSLCDVTGYDQASRVYLAPNALFPRVPESPTKDEAIAALSVLQAPFEQFPYATLEAKAAFVSHVLTQAVRHAVDCAPMYHYTASLPGTGKTLLAGMPSLIQTGQSAPKRPFAHEENEVRKTLLASLLAGDTNLIFDNVPNGSKVRSPVLCGFVTASMYSDRKLGVSDSPTLPNRCTIAITGNNITAAGDLARRSIVVRLDVNAESALQRDFKISDLSAHVARYRPQLLVAALTVIRAYIVAGCPTQYRALPSFERWSMLARNPLLWLDQADPVDTQEIETDDEIGPLRAAFHAINTWPAFNKGFTGHQLADACNGFHGNREAAALREALELAGCSDPSQSKQVGYWLRANRDRVADGLKLRSPGTSGGVARWILGAPKL